MSEHWITILRDSVREQADRRASSRLVPRSCWVAWPLALLILWVISTPRAAALDPGRAPTQYQTRSWGPDDGLPCNGILSVIQASDGYLWLGTEEGLVRFDGVRARVFDRQTDPVLVGNTVYTAAENARRPGELLLGSAGGVCRFAGGRVQAYPSGAAPAGQPGRILFQDPADGALWVRTSRGLGRVGPGGDASGPLEAASGWPAETIRALCRDGAGFLWAGTTRGLYRQHGQGGEDSQRFDLIPGWAGKAVDYLAPARNGGLWVGSRDAGSGRLGEDGVFHPRAALAGCLVTAVLEDRDGLLWVGTQSSGLQRLTASEEVAADAEPPAAPLTTGHGLVNNRVNGLCEDREGNLWVATQGGLQVLRSARFVNFGRPEGLAGNNVRTVFEGRSGQICIGGENGLDMLNPAGNRVVNYPLPASTRRPGDGLVLCVGPGDADDDALLVGTNAGLVRWREGTMALLPVREDLDGSAVRALCRDPAGNQWVGTDTGLYQVRDNQVVAHFTASGGLAHDGVRALLADRRGNLWIANDGGLNRLGPDGRITGYLSHAAKRIANGVLALLEHPSRAGEIFVGTEFGLHRLRAAGGGEVQVTSYTTREGLSEDLIWALLDDGQGNLWMSSNKGVSRVARADLERFDRGEIASVPHVTYGKADGMRSRECNGGHQPAAWRDQGGRLWFATIEGATMVDPARAGTTSLPPPVLIEELLVDDQVVPAGATAAGAPPIALPAGTQKIGFRYTALGFVAPEANRFRHRLVGFDTDWTDAGTERTAHYTNLPPGFYQFSVQASNSDGVWNMLGTTLSLHLRPFFYQTAWFRAMASGAAVMVLWIGLHLLRRRWHLRLARAETELRERRGNQETLRQAKEEAERERRVAEQARAEAERANAAKSEFLSRMSHELRTPLNAILGFGQLLEMEAPPAHLDSIGHILGGGRHLLGLVDEILDLSRVERGQAVVCPEELALAPLVAEATGLIATLARDRDVEVRVAPEVATVHVLADPQRLKQVMLNLLSNAIKYNRASGGAVFIGVQEVVPAAGSEPIRQRVSVRDTGAGIDPVGLGKLFTPFERLGAAYGPIKGTGLGLAVSKQLVEAMGGTIGVESTLGLGTTFWVELPSAAAPPKLPPLPPTPTRTAVSTVNCDRQNLLYIEDNDSNRRLVENILAQHRPDLCLRVAPDGHTGLAAARAIPRLGLILLDLQLPDLAGDEVLVRLRADPATRAIPVVILSADATARSRTRLQAAGAAAYVTKPLELRPLLELLAEYLPAPLPTEGAAAIL